MLHKPSSAKDYFLALSVAVILFVILGGYLYVRRGYMLDAPASAGPLYVPNKAIAAVGLMLLAIVFLIGPVVRYFDTFDHWLSYRKEIGIVGGFLIIAHGIISAWFIPAKFSLTGLFSSDYSFTAWAGLAGALVLASLIVLSLKSMIEAIGGSPWWFLQRWGLRLVILFTALHVLPMKWAGWEKWFLQGVPKTPELANPWMTPASILVALFLAWVVLVRLYETVFLFRDFGWKTKEISIDPVLRARGRRFFIVSFWLLMGLYVIVLTRWAI
ncbi:MAG: hypothetical protein ABI747_03495 [Candidatus Moraniibacteriota bacterium]